jgi:ribosome-associated protein
LQGRHLADYVAKLIWQKKGLDIQILDLRGLTSITDFFVICTAESDAQVKAILEHIQQQLVIKPWHVEGFDSLNWALLDFVDVVVHIFQSETREFYSLERLWGDAKVIEIKDKDAAAPLH